MEKGQGSLGGRGAAFLTWNLCVVIFQWHQTWFVLLHLENQTLSALDIAKSTTGMIFDK